MRLVGARGLAIVWRHEGYLYLLGAVSVALVSGTACSWDDGAVDLGREQRWCEQRRERHGGREQRWESQWWVQQRTDQRRIRSAGGATNAFGGAGRE